MLQAPPWERKVPFNTEPAPIVIAPVATPAPPIQKTLQRRAPLVKIIFDCAATENAPANLKTNMASGLF